MASAEDVEGDALERMQQEQLKAELWECVDSLPGQQPEVLERVRQKVALSQQVDEGKTERTWQNRGCND